MTDFVVEFINMICETLTFIAPKCVWRARTRLGSSQRSQIQYLNFRGRDRERMEGREEGKEGGAERSGGKRERKGTAVIKLIKLVTGLDSYVKLHDFCHNFASRHITRQRSTLVGYNGFSATLLRICRKFDAVSWETRRRVRPSYRNAIGTLVDDQGRI